MLDISSWVNYDKDVRISIRVYIFNIYMIAYIMYINTNQKKTQT